MHAARCKMRARTGLEQTRQKGRRAREKAVLKGVGAEEARRRTEGAPTQPSGYLAQLRSACCRVCRYGDLGQASSRLQFVGYGVYVE